MQTLWWGVALVIIGLFLTFSNVFGIVLGGPLITIGVILIAIGIILGIVHFVTGRTAGGMTRRRTL